MEDEPWRAYFLNPAPPRPSLTKIIEDLKEKELVSPTFVCLQCTKESSNQHAMASHCKLHVEAGMAKGTVEHIKYNPDHTYTFLCSNPQPIPQAPRSDGPAFPEQPKQIIQVPKGSSNPILPYAGRLFISEIARSPFLQFNRKKENFVRRNNMLPSFGVFQQRSQTQIASSSTHPFGSIQDHSPKGGVGQGSIPNPVTPQVDLTLRLGVTTFDDSAKGASLTFPETANNATYKPDGDDCNGKKVMRGP
ncbi:hypothetical protein ACP70R_001855 [Stipagrostis hirtigluma subsp. patula]